MDIEQYKKIVESCMKASKIKHQVKSEIENYEDKQMGDYEQNKQTFKPLIESTDEVKKKQDQMIAQMKHNQLALIENLPKNNNGDRLQELEDAGVEKEPLITLETNYDDNLTDVDIHFIHNSKLQLPSKLFNDGIKYSQKENKIFNEYLVQLVDLRNELAQKNKITKSNPENIAPRKKYYKTIEKIIDALKSIKLKKTGSGNRRKYKQPERNAYKIRENKYGGLLINMPKLINEMVLEVSKNGKILYQDQGDQSLINLLTKKYDPKKKYSSKAIEIFNYLNMLSNVPPHKSSMKYQLGTGNIYFTNADQLFRKLQLITGSRSSGNNNIRLKNEAYQIIDKLLEIGAINKIQYDRYVQQHLI